MGFKNNKIPFLLVAQRTGLGRARGPNGEALLFGLSGFLKVGDFDEGDHEARSYLRELWEKWWVLRDREAPGSLGRCVDFLGCPASEPSSSTHGRACRGRALVTSFRKMIDAGNPDDFVKGLAARTSLLAEPCEPGGSFAPQATSLVGADRALDILVNVFLPARGYEDAWRQLGTLSHPSASRKVLTASEWLLGASRPAHLRSAMCRKGCCNWLRISPTPARKCGRFFIGGWIPPGIVRPVGKNHLGNARWRSWRFLTARGLPPILEVLPEHLANGGIPSRRHGSPLRGGPRVWRFRFAPPRRPPAASADRRKSGAP